MRVALLQQRENDPGCGAREHDDPCRDPDTPVMDRLIVTLLAVAPLHQPLERGAGPADGQHHDRARLSHPQQIGRSGQHEPDNHDKDDEIGRLQRQAPRREHTTSDEGSWRGQRHRGVGAQHDALGCTIVMMLSL